MHWLCQLKGVKSLHLTVYLLTKLTHIVEAVYSLEHIGTQCDNLSHPNALPANVPLDARLEWFSIFDALCQPSFLSGCHPITHRIKDTKGTR